MVVRWWLGLSGLAAASLIAPAQAAMPIPRAVCVTPARVAVFDVHTPGTRHVRVPRGRRNRLTGGRVLGRQPTRFAPGNTRAALHAKVTRRRVAWRLGARVARLARAGPRCPLSPPQPPERRPPVTPPPPPADPPPPVFDPPLPRTIFSPTSFWNATIPGNVSFATASVMVGHVPTPVNPTVGRELAAVADTIGTRVNYRWWTVPLTRVPAATPLQPVRLCRSYPSGCLPGWGVTLDRALRGVARDGRYLGGGVPVPQGFSPRPDTDLQAVFYQPDYVAPDGTRGRLYELWGFRQNPDFDAAHPVSPANPRWMAAWGGRMVGVTGQGLGYWRDCWWRGCGFQADTVADPDAWGRPDSQAQDHSWGATATSLPLLGTEIALDECRSGIIQHAVGINVPNARLEHWWPAQRTDGDSDTTTIIEGMRLTFPAGTRKPAGLTPLGSSLWDAARRHGLVLDDRTGLEVGLRVEPGCETTAWWGGIAAESQLRHFPWAELRVIARGDAEQPNPTS